MSDKCVMSPSTFLVDSGLLFEINRRILHPLGLALSVDVPDNGTALEQDFGVIQIVDMREDPEGVCFEDATYLEGKAKLKTFLEKSQFQERLMSRRTRLGYVVQSMPPDPEPTFIEGVTLKVGPED